MLWHKPFAIGSRFFRLLCWESGAVVSGTARGSFHSTGLGLDAHGQPATVPQAAIEVIMLPIGGPKGYGIALVNGILAGILTGSTSWVDVRSIHDVDQLSPVGFFFQTIQIEVFNSFQDFFHRLESQLTEIRSSPRVQGLERIYIPGEIE